MATATASGVFMFAVHFFNKYIPPAEYGLFTALLSMLVMMQIPAIGLQGVFAQQTASALSDEDQARLAATTRAVLAGTFAIWLVMVAVAFFWRQEILSTLKIRNPSALWITFLLGLTALWSPIFTGILQGRQNFFWMGWGNLLSGVGRVSMIALFVVVLKTQAAGMMAAVLCSALPVLAIYIWQSREVWRRAGAAFSWRSWMERVVPLTFGLGSSVFIFSVDNLWVRRVFPEEATGSYGAVATVGRALVTFTAPIVAVMFPKIAASFAKSEKSNALGLTLASTAVLGALAVTGLAIFGGLLFRIVFPAYVGVASLSAFYALCILPQALGNVLLNNLLAQSRFRVVPWMVLTAIAYFTALNLFGIDPKNPDPGRVPVDHETFNRVIVILGIFSLIYFLMTLFFTWKSHAASPAGSPQKGQ